MAKDSLMDFTHLEKVLQEVAKDAAETYKYQLSLGGKNASYKLANSVVGYAEQNGTRYEVRLDLEDYWKYVEGGAQGTEQSPAGAIYPAHRPPIWAIEKWVNVKPILPDPSKFGNLPSPTQLAFAIATKIEQFGIEPHPAMQTTIDEIVPKWNKAIADAFAQDVEGWLNKSLDIIAGEVKLEAF